MPHLESTLVPQGTPACSQENHQHRLRELKLTLMPYIIITWHWLGWFEFLERFHCRKIYCFFLFGVGCFRNSWTLPCRNGLRLFCCCFSATGSLSFGLAIIIIITITFHRFTLRSCWWAYCKKFKQTHVASLTKMTSSFLLQAFRYATGSISSYAYCLRMTEKMLYFPAIPLLEYSITGRLVRSSLNDSNNTICIKNTILL